ncbi:MAG: bifunctional UDP-N-acetylglucosamine diphosphorylase/glucosamine-1-phosphate N-acetyltransferase GlmU, partial [Pseudomonadales bacterium]|nr:bifunctional UDP-N-acetylglucosamine diphosphorylase/glucosamine-1-phosphate N-acetyltransferase GlmU [Pseudomonadales bacterium]
MRSKLPKVLHCLAGKSLLAHVLDTARLLEPKKIHVVSGYGTKEIQLAFESAKDINWVFQREQKGTAHAVQQALPHIHNNSNVLVLYGDVPLISLGVLQNCVDRSQRVMRLVTTIMSDPAGLGRIVRDANNAVCEIVEEKDADDEQKAILEINTGILFAPGKELGGYLENLLPDNAQGELYLTDVIAAAVQDRLPVESIVCEKPMEVMGVNNRAQLAEIERYYQFRAATQLLAAGVGLADPKRVDIRGALTVGTDCFIDCNVVFEGVVVLGNGVWIEPGVIIRDSIIDDDVSVLANSVIEGARIESECVVGPFARLRPGTHLSAQVKIGNFVETKNVELGKGAKASHLSYLGDASVGAGSNIGAGTIFCNYDGVDKHKTEIGEGVFVGSNSTLVAPIKVDAGAFVAA